MRFVILCILLATVAGWGQTLTRGDVHRILKEHSPTGFFIMDQYDRMPTSFKRPNGTTTLSKMDYMVFARQPGLVNVAGQLNTVVHETYHSLFTTIWMALAPDQQGPMGAAYVGGNKFMVMPFTGVFRSLEIVPDLPPELTRVSRFDTYIGPKSSRDHVTQVFGIYGLVNEFSAYHIGTRTAFDLLPYYEKHAGNDPAAWVGFINGVEGTMTSHAEFRAFILYYLMRAKVKKPELYAAMMANRALLQTFVKTDDQFAQLITDYHQAMESLLPRLQARGLTVSRHGDFVNFSAGGTSQGTKFQLNDYRKLLTLSDTPACRAMLAEIRKAAR